MDDLISRQEVFDIINNILHGRCDYSVYSEVFDAVDALPCIAADCDEAKETI